MSGLTIQETADDCERSVSTRNGNAAHETTVHCHGFDLYVRRRGKGHPLLMINGLGNNVDMWGHAEDRLSKVAQTIVFDTPGSGRSRAPLWPMSISSLAGVAASVVDELGHGSADVLGFSLGGLIAQQLAHDHPERVRRLALVSTACGWGSMPGTLDALALLTIPVRYYSRTLYEQTQHMLGPADRELLARVKGISEARLSHPPSLLGYSAQLWAGAFWSSLSWLPSVAAPTLVVHGEGDHLVPPANGFQLAHLLRTSRLHVLPNEGHLLVADPDGGAIPLLADFFGADELESSEAWTSGESVVDERTVDAAFAESVGAQPYRALSEAYRKFVRSSSRRRAGLV